MGGVCTDFQEWTEGIKLKSCVLCHAGTIGIWVDASFGWLQLGPVPRQVARQSGESKHYTCRAQSGNAHALLYMANSAIWVDATCFVRVCALLSYRDQTCLNRVVFLNIGFCVMSCLFSWHT